MLFYQLLMISLCVFSNYIMSMEEIPFKEKLKAFDQAQIIASSPAEETWKDYAFSSRLIVEIIKKRKLLISNDPTEEEVAIIKNMKKDERQKYDQLVGELRDALRNPVNEMERMQAKQWSVDWCAFKDREEELNAMQKAITYFDIYDKKHTKFWKPKAWTYAHFLSVLLMTELTLFLVLGMADIVCFLSYEKG